MTWPDADRLHRTAKQLVDSGRVGTQTEAEAVLRDWVLQVHVGPEVERDPAAQAALLTVVNAGHRAFLGGVDIHSETDCLLGTGWARGLTVSDAIVRWGGRHVNELSMSHPTVVIGSPRHDSAGDLVVSTAFNGWAGAVVAAPIGGGESGIALAGVVAGGLAVSECFQHLVGDVEAGLRDVGVSLWRPDVAWDEPEAHGPSLAHLPAALWLLGLGHLGQGYAWSLGLLPYASPGDVTVLLVDTDTIVEGNLATALLAQHNHVGIAKTRVVSSRLEEVGLTTRIVERRFDKQMCPAPDEPSVALAGFDSPYPRQELGSVGFARIVDAGLGAGPVEYLDMTLHSFPSTIDPAEAFVPRAGKLVLRQPYLDEIQRRVKEGQEHGDAACGVTEIAGITVGAAFVGAIAGALGVADVLRYLHEGKEFSVLALDLRNPSQLVAVPNTAPGPYQNLGFTSASD